MTLEQKLRKVHTWAFYKRYSECYEKSFAEAYAEGYREGYAEGLTKAILEWRGFVEADMFAEWLEISVDDILRIWEQV